MNFLDFYEFTLYTSLLRIGSRKNREFRKNMRFPKNHIILSFFEILSFFVKKNIDFP